jgi:HD-GYP domain-containing protein (c-di-GMP phosphodiesterase class II)
MTEPAPRPEVAQDFLAHCVAATTGNPLLEQIRDKSSEAALAVFRLVKNALVHAIDNEAVVQTIQQSHEILTGFSREVGSSVTLTYAGDTVFVCGQLLRASRQVYEATMQLGQLLEKCEVSEVSFEPTLTPADLSAFAAAVAISAREPQQRRYLAESKIPNVAVRHVDALLMRRTEDEDLPPSERIVRMYATALLVMRQFFDDIARGKTILPHRVKRLSQRFVTLAETGDPAMLGMTSMANAHRDDAGRAVQTALLSVLVAKQLIHDRVTLARLAMAAMMADVGRVRVAGPEGRARFVALPDTAEVTVPTATATVCLATGGLNPSNALRTVVATEANWVERQAMLPPLYLGKTALPQSEIIRQVRRLLELLAPRDSTRSLSPAAALQALAAEPNTDRVVLRLLVRTVGVIPAGSIVEFETGEWAVAIGPSSNPAAAHLPRVRLVTDRKGRALQTPVDLDLGAPSAGRQYPRVSGIVDPARAKFNVARAFLSAA